MDPVVGLDWVRAHPERAVLADVRYYLDGRSSRAAYDGGHLPGAIFVDLERDLAAPASAAGGRHPLPDPETFAERMASLGVGDGDIVIAYDDAGGVMAARLVWMLRATGHDAALLDEIIVTARKREERFRGESEPIDPRAGHIPGARNVPCRDNVDDAGRFLSADALRDRFTAAGVTDGAAVVSYCGSGVTACHNLLALERAGLGLGRLFPGSWSQYSATDRPAATGV